MTMTLADFFDKYVGKQYRTLDVGCDNNGHHYETRQMSTGQVLKVLISKEMYNKMLKATRVRDRAAQQGLKA